MSKLSKLGGEEGVKVIWTKSKRKYSFKRTSLILRTLLVSAYIVVYMPVYYFMVRASAIVILLKNRLCGLRSKKGMDIGQSGLESVKPFRL